jgi:hypothetical protein
MNKISTQKNISKTSNKEIKSSLKNETIHSILNFSKSLVVNKSLNKTIKFVEYNLN